MIRALTTLVICCSLAGISFATVANPPAATLPSLADKYSQLKNKLEHSIFGAPLLLNSKSGDDYAQGEVYALLDTPFTLLAETLSQPAQWCEMLILHVNIKTCTYGKNQVRLYVGRKYYETPDEAFLLQYRFIPLAVTNKHLHIALTAPEGPFGTSDYLITLEATPIDADHSFIRFQYRYQFGFMARIAMQTYLATLGHDKVGFTVTGTDENGEAIYIRGLQGIVERNVMRYVFAIQAVLEAQKSPPEYRHTAQLVRWYAHTLEHPRQLAELSREEYMHNKRHERRNQEAMQKAMSSKKLLPKK